MTRLIDYAAIYDHQASFILGFPFFKFSDQPSVFFMLSLCSICNYENIFELMVVM